MRHLLLLVFCFCFSPGWAQDYVDLFEGSYQYSEANLFDAQSGEKSGSRASIHEVNSNFLVPIPTGDHAIITGLRLTQLTISAGPGVPDSSNLLGLGLPLGVSWKHSDSWNTLLLGLPRIQSNSAAFSAEHIQIAGLLLITKQQSERLKWKFGLYFNTEFQGPFLVPMLGVYWKPTDRIEINATLPQKATFDFYLNNSIALGAAFRSSLTSYRLGEELSNRYYVRFSNEILGTFSWSIHRSIVLQAGFGLAIGRYIRLFDENDRVDGQISAVRFGDDRIQRNAEFGDGWIGRAQLSYRFWK